MLRHPQEPRSSARDEYSRLREWSRLAICRSWGASLSACGLREISYVVNGVEARRGPQ
jgi:hypothetical protein